MINDYIFRVLKGFLILVLFSLSFSACAIDNPGAPDYIVKFEQRSKPFLMQINNPDNNNREIVAAYSNYQDFLEKEMNAAYQLLKTKLSKPEYSELKKSQQKWIAFRNAEFNFIDNNWTRKNFGSSFVISRGDYKCAMIKNRILMMLNYAKNY